MHPPEFTALASRWLDGACSEAEATRLWAILAEHPSAAREFAAMAHFELLLEDTMREQAQEAPVKAVARKQQRQITWMRWAAVLLITGAASLPWWWSNHAPASREVVATAPAPVPPAPVEVAPRKRLGGHSIYVERPSTSVTKVDERSLNKRLDDFFLSSVSIRSQPLAHALQQLEAQLRTLNFHRRADLDRLRVKLPVSAAERIVSLETGSISFLKAVETLAQLAYCDLHIETAGLSLTARAVPTMPITESRDMEGLLAQHLSGDREALKRDAAAVGLTLSDDEASLQGGAEQFRALERVRAARFQVESLPPLPLVAFAQPTKNQAEPRRLTGEEARAALAQAEREGRAVVKLAVAPSYDEPSSSSERTSDQHVSFQPAGDGTVRLSLDPGPNQPHTFSPIDVFAARPGGVQVPVAAMGPTVTMSSMVASVDTNTITFAGSSTISIRGAGTMTTKTMTLDTMTYTTSATSNGGGLVLGDAVAPQITGTNSISGNVSLSNNSINATFASLTVVVDPTD